MADGRHLIDLHETWHGDAFRP